MMISTKKTNEWKSEWSELSLSHNWFWPGEESNAQTADNFINHQQPVDAALPKQQPAVEEENNQPQHIVENQQDVRLLEPECRHLRNREQLNPIEHYGMPIAWIAETLPMTYSDTISCLDAEKW